MRIRLPITEQFLWDVYGVLEELGRIGEVLGPRSVREIGFSEIRILRNERRRVYNRKSLAKLVYYLKKKEIIRAPDWETKDGIIITKKGIEKMFDVAVKMKGKKRRGDGKWEMVAFDIPEKKRGARNDLRFYLKILGYKQLQQSVWISPYEVLRETQHLVKKYNLEDNVKIFIIEKP